LGLRGAFLMGVLASIPFDYAEFYYFGSLNMRVWYFLLPPLLLVPLPHKKLSLLLIALILLVGLTPFLVTPLLAGGQVSNLALLQCAKLYFGSVLAPLVLFLWFRKLGYLIPWERTLAALLLFICVYGLLQVAIPTDANPFMHVADNRPVGLFSETTWFAETIVIVGLPLALSWLAVGRTVGAGALLSICFPLLILTETRAAFLGMATCIALFLAVIVTRIHFEREISRSSILVVVATATFAIFAAFLLEAFGMEFLHSKLLQSVGRFSLGDGSASQRVEGFTIGTLDVLDFPFGQMVTEKNRVTAITGAIVGIKHFSLPFALQAGFGLQGIFIFFGILALFYRAVAWRVLSEPALNPVAIFRLTSMSAWLVMATFSPLHFYPPTLLIALLIAGVEKGNGTIGQAWEMRARHG
jgi:hypothetical protein